jgi:hypothetical protein
MEKALGLTVFLASSLLPCIAFADVEETFTYGSQTTSEPLSFKDWNYVTHGVLNGGAASQVAGSEYSNYRAAEAKKKAREECKAKEATRNHKALEVKCECIERHEYSAVAQRTQCTTVVQATTEATVTVSLAGQTGTATAS